MPQIPTKSKSNKDKKPLNIGAVKDSKGIKEVPSHIAMIMDGNGRWAKKRFQPRVFGHRAGLKAVRRAINLCNDYGVKYLTLFAFSSENWARPKDEVDYLMSLFIQTLEKEIDELHDKGIQLNILGDVKGLSTELRERIYLAQEKTQSNRDLVLNLAINYGGRWDIVQASQRIASAVKNHDINIEDIDEALFCQYLSTKNMPAPELLIRTSEEYRISNFLLWQCAYSEFYFTKKLWPDFNEDVFVDALLQFNSRQRRFGKTGEQLGDQNDQSDKNSSSDKSENNQTTDSPK